MFSSSKQQAPFQWLTGPVTFGWVGDYWCFICAAVAHLRLLRLSYVKMRDCQKKPQGCKSNLSIFWFFSATASLFLLQSLSFLSVLTFNNPPPHPLLISTLPFHHIYFPTFHIQPRSQFWCRFAAGLMVSWYYDVVCNKEKKKSNSGKTVR